MYLKYSDLFYWRQLDDKPNLPLHLDLLLTGWTVVVVARVIVVVVFLLLVVAELLVVSFGAAVEFVWMVMLASMFIESISPASNVKRESAERKIGC